MKVYLDNAATTSLRNEVIDEMLPFMKEQYGNPSSIHAYGREVRSRIEKGRKSISKLLKCSPSEIYFTSSGTEANNTIIKGCVTGLGVTHVISSKIEHHCVLHSVEEVGKIDNVMVHYVELDEKGHVDLESLEELLSRIDGKVLVTLMHANNELGNLIDLKKLSGICRKYNAYLHSDTVQTLGHYQLDLGELDIDFVSGSGHKFHGPKGAGLLYVNGRIKLGPFIHGGSQERNMRAGTENTYGIVGLIKALEIAHEDMDEDVVHIQSIKDYMIKQLEDNIVGVSFNGDAKGNSLYTVLNANIPVSKDSDMLLFNLDIAGIAASSGSACSSGSSVGSHVLSCIGASTDGASIRFSFSRFTTKGDIDYTINQLKDILNL